VPNSEQFIVPGNATLMWLVSQRVCTQRRRLGGCPAGVLARRGGNALGTAGKMPALQSEAYEAADRRADIARGGFIMYEFRQGECNGGKGCGT
jgi:hypothetical protein